MNYDDAGVSLHSADMISAKLSAKYPWLGGFAGLFDIGNDYLVASTDGVGTKGLLALKYPDMNIGQDLVAMSVNDVICTGAKPLFFLDYIAMGKLHIDVAEKLISSMVDALDYCQMPLLGGETAEMPDVYDDGVFDIAGFAVGAVPKTRYGKLDGQNIRKGDELIGIASDGPHANGYSLIRKVLEASDTPSDEVLNQILAPTKLYTKTVAHLMNTQEDFIHGMAHITGGGRDNLLRLLGEDINAKPEWDYSSVKTPECFNWLAENGNISDTEMLRVFNMGIGMIIVVAEGSANAVMLALNEIEETAWHIGKIVERQLTN